MWSTRTGSSLLRWLHVIVLLGCLAGLLAAPGTAAQDAPLNLAAVKIHPDELDWLIEEQSTSGLLDDAPYFVGRSAYFTTIDEVLASQVYLEGRGVFAPARVGSDALGDMLDESGWVRTVDTLLLRQASVVERQWVFGIGVSIEEYESAEGAELAFATFNDAEALSDIVETDEVEALDAPALGDQASMWSIQSVQFGSPPVPVISLWVQADNLIVSVSSADASQVSEPDPAHVERLMEFQLQRLELAEYLYQPHLADCAPRLAGDGVIALNDAYMQLNGQRFGRWDETYPMIQAVEDSAVDHGIVNHYRLVQEVAGTGSGVDSELFYFWGQTRGFVDAQHAADYLAAVDAVLEEDGAEEVSESDTVQDIGDSSRIFTYAGEGGSVYTELFVQVGDLVTSFKFGPSPGPLPDAVSEVAMAYLNRLADGDCGEPLDVPADL